MVWTAIVRSSVRLLVLLLLLLLRGLVHRLLLLHGLVLRRGLVHGLLLLLWLVMVMHSPVDGGVCSPAPHCCSRPPNRRVCKLV